MIIIAPWTPEQVDNLNRFQRASIFHPFMCAGHEGGGDPILVATRGGWICAHCGYTLNWAHSDMMEFTVEREKTVSPATVPEAAEQDPLVPPSAAHPIRT